VGIGECGWLFQAMIAHLPLLHIIWLAGWLVVKKPETNLTGQPVPRCQDSLGCHDHLDGSPVYELEV